MALYFLSNKPKVESNDVKREASTISSVASEGVILSELYKSDKASKEYSHGYLLDLSSELADSEKSLEKSPSSGNVKGAVKKQLSIVKEISLLLDKSHKDTSYLRDSTDEYKKLLQREDNFIQKL